MKTTTTLKNIAKGMNILAVTILLSCITTKTATAQNSNIGITIKNTCSMGGLGSVIAPELTYKVNRHQFALGLNVQKTHQNLAGLRTSYKFIFNPGGDNEVFAFCESVYFNKAYLNKRTAKFETKINPENGNYYNTARINSLEQYIGLGVNVYQNSWLNFYGAIGGGFYKSFGVNKELFGYRDVFSTSIMLTAGVNFTIRDIK